MSRPIALGQDPVLRHAVDGAAARVIRPGFKYCPAKKVLTGDQSMPFLLKKLPTNSPSMIDLTGAVVGRLLILGLAADHNGKWAARCQCGTYTLRSAKSIKNEANAQDRCEHCRHLAFLKRQDHYRTTGHDKDIKKF